MFLSILRDVLLVMGCIHATISWFKTEQHCFPYFLFYHCPFAIVWANDLHGKIFRKMHSSRTVKWVQVLVPRTRFDYLKAKYFSKYHKFETQNFTELFFNRISIYFMEFAKTYSSLEVFFSLQCLHWILDTSYHWHNLFRASIKFVYYTL